MKKPEIQRFQAYQKYRLFELVGPPAPTIVGVNQETYFIIIFQLSISIYLDYLLKTQ